MCRVKYAHRAAAGQHGCRRNRNDAFAGWDGQKGDMRRSMGMWGVVPVLPDLDLSAGVLSQQKLFDSVARLLVSNGLYLRDKR